MAIAADDADSSALISLAHRRGNLPIEILSTQIILERLYLQRDEARLSEFRTEAQKLAEIVAEKLKILADAQTQFNFASGNQSSAASDVSETRMSINERKRTIEVLLREARNVKIAPSSLQMHGGR
jgi:UDP-2,3-diacylglucosamine pyrophosphatase LpxH